MEPINIQNDDTRKKILKAALDLFSKYGFDGVSTRRIAQVANCNIASLNYHFGTKKKLYQECILVMEPKAKYELAQILSTPTNRGDFEKSFSSYCISVAEFIVENAASIKLLINEINSGEEGPRNDSFLGPLRSALEAFLIESKEQNIINPAIDVELFSNMVISSIISQKLFKSFRTYEEISNEELAKRIIISTTSDFYIS